MVFSIKHVQLALVDDYDDNVVVVVVVVVQFS